MNQLKSAQEALYQTIYKKNNSIPVIEVLYEDSYDNKFFTKVEHGETTIDDIQEIRYWKNKLVSIRDKYEHGGTMWTMFNEELKRVMLFLESFA